MSIFSSIVPLNLKWLPSNILQLWFFTFQFVWQLDTKTNIVCNHTLQSWHSRMFSLPLEMKRILKLSFCPSALTKQPRCTRTSVWLSPDWYLSWRKSSWTSPKRSNSRTQRWRTWPSPSNGGKHTDTNTCLDVPLWIIQRDGWRWRCFSTRAHQQSYELMAYLLETLCDD